MAINVTNIRYIQKTGKGHMLETPIMSSNISQLESDIQQFLLSKGLTAESNVTKSSLIIKNIKSTKTGKRAPPWVYARIRQMIASGLENRNMIANVTGGS